MFVELDTDLKKKTFLLKNAEMNLTELEEALQQLNQHLISEKELQYIYHVRSYDHWKPVYRYSIAPLIQLPGACIMDFCRANLFLMISYNMYA